MARPVSWAQGSCPETSVAAALSGKVQTEPPWALGKLDIMEEHSSGTKVPGDLTDMKLFPQVPSASIPSLPASMPNVLWKNHSYGHARPSRAEGGQ